MNSITICGNIGQAPELRYTTSGRPCCEFSVADNRPKGKDGQEVTQWFRCHAYDRTGELIAQYFDKGRPIFVQGVLQAALYSKRDGGTGMSLDVQVTSFDFVNVGGGQRKPGDPVEPTPPTPAPRAQADAEPEPGMLEVPDITDPFADQ